MGSDWQVRVVVLQVPAPSPEAAGGRVSGGLCIWSCDVGKREQLKPKAGNETYLNGESRCGSRLLIGGGAALRMSRALRWWRPGKSSPLCSFATRSVKNVEPCTVKAKG